MKAKFIQTTLLAAASLPLVGCVSYGYDEGYGTPSNQVYYRHASYGQPRHYERCEERTFLYNKMYAPQYSPVTNRTPDTLVVVRPDGTNEIYPAPMR